MAKNEVAVRAPSAMVVADERPDYLPAITGAARGSEQVTVKDLTIPRLDVVQALSPYRKKSDPKFIEGAVEGDLINSLTLENYGDSVLIVPVIFKKEYLVWKERKLAKDGQGGFFGAFATMEQAEERVEQVVSEGQAREELVIQDTPQNFSYVITPSGAVQEIVLSMARSKAKASRKLNSLVRLNGGDRFSRVYKIFTVEETNKKGDTFYNIDVDTAGYPSKEVYLLAEHLYNAVMKGAINMAAHSDDEDGEVSTPTEY